MGAREDLPEAPEMSVEDVLMAQAPQLERVRLHGGGGELPHLVAQVAGQPQLILLSQEPQVLPLGLRIHVVYLPLQSYWRYMQRGLGHLSEGCPRDRKGGRLLGLRGNTAGPWFLSKLG